MVFEKLDTGGLLRLRILSLTYKLLNIEEVKKLCSKLILKNLPVNQIRSLKLTS